MISEGFFGCDGILVGSDVLAHEGEIEVLAAARLHCDTREFRKRFVGFSDKAFFEALEADALQVASIAILSRLKTRGGNDAV